MLNLHKYYLLTRKVLFILFFVLVSSFLILYLLSNSYLDHSSLILDSLIYREEYLANSRVFLELASVSLVVILMVNFFNKHSNSYSLFLITSKSKKINFLFTKLIFIALLITLLISILYMESLVIFKLTPYFLKSLINYKFLLSLIINALVYLGLASLFFVLFKSELFSYSLFIFYYLMKLLTKHKYYKFFCLLIPGFRGDELYYSYFYYTCLILYYLIISLFIYLVKDI